MILLNDGLRTVITTKKSCWVEKHDDFLDESPSLKASLDFRLPYFNVLNYIQIELIKRLRNNNLTDDEISLIHITINGIATGLRNSG